MSKPFDATLKELIDNNPDDWVRLVAGPLGLPEGIKAEPIDADLSTVSPQADKLFQLSGTVDALLHLELQSGWDGTLGDRALLYSVLARYRLSLPVHTVLVLLHRKADGGTLTGELKVRHSDGSEYLTFRYNVLRVWNLSAEELLRGGLGTIVLALLTDDAAQDPAGLFQQFEERVESSGLDQSQKAQLESAAFIMMGLRFDEALIKGLFREAKRMEESSTYQWLLQKGRVEGRVEGQVEGMHQAIIIMGEGRWGAIMPNQQSVLEAIADIDRLKRMTKRVFEASNWDELLATR